jgi:hypothetical protein
MSENEEDDCTKQGAEADPLPAFEHCLAATMAAAEAAQQDVERWDCELTVYELAMASLRTVTGLGYHPGQVALKLAADMFSAAHGMAVLALTGVLHGSPPPPGETGGQHPQEHSPQAERLWTWCRATMFEQAGGAGVFGLSTAMRVIQAECEEGMEQAVADAVASADHAGRQEIADALEEMGIDVDSMLASVANANPMEVN